MIVLRDNVYVHSDHLGFVLEFIDQFGDIGNDHPGQTPGRLRDFERAQSRLDVDAEFGRLQGDQRLFLAFMMLGKVG